MSAAPTSSPKRGGGEARELSGQGAANLPSGGGGGQARKSQAEERLQDFGGEEGPPRPRDLRSCCVTAVLPGPHRAPIGSQTLRNKRINTKSGGVRAVAQAPSLPQTPTLPGCVLTFYFCHRKAGGTLFGKEDGAEARAPTLSQADQVRGPVRPFQADWLDRFLDSWPVGVERTRPLPVTG